VTAPGDPPQDCWKRIGVYGDSSCPQLAAQVHCRNCPVYAVAASRLLDTDVPAGYLDEWTSHVAAREPATLAERKSVVIFRLAAEWFALPATSLKEIAADRRIHSLPHRRNGAVLGLTNIRGQLLVCTSLKALLGIETKEPLVGGRMMVLQHNGLASACPVDEVHGLEQFHVSELRSAPATLAAAAGTFTRTVLAWRTRSVGMLDVELLFHSINRSFQSPTST